jgi:hypothetical protein
MVSIIDAWSVRGRDLPDILADTQIEAWNTLQGDIFYSTIGCDYCDHRNIIQPIADTYLYYRRLVWHQYLVLSLSHK